MTEWEPKHMIKQSKMKTCRFCRDICENMQKVDEVIIEVVDVLFPNLNLDITEDAFICNNCTEILHNCFKFKSTYFYIEEFISPLVNSKDNINKLDLKELYMKNQCLEVHKISADQKMCRFCMELICGSWTLVCAVDETILQKCIPEGNFNLTKDPVICDACYEFLKLYAHFIDKYIGTERKVNDYKDIHKSELVIQDEILEFSVKRESYLATEESEREFDIKMESELQLAKFEDQLSCTEEDKCVDTKNPVPFNRVPSKKERFFCPHCNYNTVNKYRLPSHMRTRHKELMEPKIKKIHKCPECWYVGDNSYSLRMHMIRHEDPTKLKMYTCPLCTFKAKYKNGITSHMRSHEEKYKFECKLCSFRSKYIESYKRHMLKHKDKSEQPFLHCAQCQFKTLHKYILQVHIMKEHTDPSKAVKYSCDKCTYSTFNKYDFKGHTIIHRDLSEMQTYKCEKCDYVSKTKKQLRYHSLVHMDASETIMYNCKICTYQTKRKGDIAPHMLKHKNPSEIRKFKCDICNMAFKRKSNLTKHKLRHDFPNPMKYKVLEHEFKCAHCRYETTNKALLKSHIVRHINQPKDQMFKCDLCERTFGRNSSLALHKKWHKLREKVDESFKTS